VFNPSSKVYDYTSVELKPNGDNEVSVFITFYQCVVVTTK